jgi:hypothetical protein
MPAVNIFLHRMYHHTSRYSPPALGLVMRSLTAGIARKRELDGQGRKSINFFLYCVAVFVLDSKFNAYCACYIGVWWYFCDRSLLETSKSLSRMRDVGQFVVVPSLSCLSHSLDPKVRTKVCGYLMDYIFGSASGFLCRRTPRALSVLHQRPDRVNRLLEEWVHVEHRGTILFASPSMVDDGTVPGRCGIDAYDTARVSSNHDRS